MKSRRRLVVIIGGIVGGSLLAFCCGLVFTLVVIMPAREPDALWPPATLEPTTEASPSPGIGPMPRSTPEEPSPTPTYAVIVSTPTQPGPAPTQAPSATVIPGQSPAPPPSPTPTSGGFPFYYVEGSRLEEENCFSQYLQGWVKDASGAPLDGVVVRWQYWNNTEYATSGDPNYLWQSGEFKFTYYAEDPGRETDFVLQIVDSTGDHLPLSEPLLIHFSGCHEMGQITNIVFKQR
jgi:hypothetical protein